MANKNITIKQVEDMRSELNTTIAEAIQKFEKETGMRIGYIDTVRKADRDAEEGCSCVKAYSEDRGPVVAINANMNMEL